MTWLHISSAAQRLAWNVCIAASIILSATGLLAKSYTGFVIGHYGYTPYPYWGSGLGLLLSGVSLFVVAFVKSGRFAEEENFEPCLR
jgi:hypothetical protein